VESGSEPEPVHSPLYPRSRYVCTIVLLSAVNVRWEHADTKAWSCIFLEASKASIHHWSQCLFHLLSISSCSEDYDTSKPRNELTSQEPLAQWFSWLSTRGSQLARMKSFVKPCF